MTHREQELFFEPLELLRKTAAKLPDFQGADWKDVDDYILNGTKTFISNGPIADTFTVLAVTDKEKGPHGMSIFILEK